AVLFALCSRQPICSTLFPYTTLFRSTVSEAVVAVRPFSDEIRVLGVARGRRSVNVTSATSQLITRVLFTDGQRVAAGAPLVELQANEQDAGVIEARARVEQAERAYERYRQLAERGVAP